MQDTSLDGFVFAGTLHLVNPASLPPHLRDCQHLPTSYRRPRRRARLPRTSSTCRTGGSCFSVLDRLLSFPPTIDTLRCEPLFVEAEILRLTFAVKPLVHSFSPRIAGMRWSRQQPLILALGAPRRRGKLVEMPEQHSQCRGQQRDRTGRWPASLSPHPQLSRTRGARHQM